MSNEENQNCIKMQEMMSKIINLVETLTLGRVVNTQLNITKTTKDYISEFPGSRPSHVNKCNLSCDIKISFNATVALKTATPEGREELKHQVHTFMDIEPDLMAYVPEVIGFDLKKDSPYFVMPFYPYPSLRDLIFEQNASGHNICIILERLLNFMFEKVYSKKVQTTPTDYVVNTHLDRIRKRLYRLSNVSDTLESLIKANVVRVGSRSHKNILPLIDEIEKSQKLIQKLQPPRTNMVHGDLEFAHVLVDTKDITSPRFVLLDPRPPPGGLDIAYDLGKLWQTFHGFLDLIAWERFVMDEYSTTRDAVSLEVFELKGEKTVDTLSYVDKKMSTLLMKYQRVQDDPYLLMRTIFSCASHICSAGPFYLRNDGEEKVAIALYVKGMQLLNDFCRSYIGGI